MRNLMILVFAVFSFNIGLNSQVKDQFRDRDNSSTIVVVKESNAIDQSVLDEHFNLADISMSDQIMIMTVPEDTKTSSAPNIENSTTSSDNNIEEFFEDIEKDKIEVETQVSNTLAEAPAKESVAVTAEIKEAPSIKKPTAVKSTTKVASTRARGNYTVKSSADVKKAAQKKYFGKIRKNKRKSNKNFFGKKKTNRCYSF